ncbi:MAG: Fur family transcriptional regulator [Alicyclobacillaceae bacterium]|nr:Fur family transcriptional regulator [Alicyclobacillaceae bacterium]
MRTLEEAVGLLKERGVRITPQRTAILQYLLTHRTHPTADEIYRAIQPVYPNVSVATVYNNLRAFQEAGLVKELTTGDHASRFDINMTPHHHAICDVCGKIVDFYHPGLENLDDVLARELGFTVTEQRLEVHGVCPDCRGIPA